MVALRYLLLIISTPLFSFFSCFIESNVLRKRQTPLSLIEFNYDSANPESSGCQGREINKTAVLEINSDLCAWPFRGILGSQWIRQPSAEAGAVGHFRLLALLNFPCLALVPPFPALESPPCVCFLHHQHHIMVHKNTFLHKGPKPWANRLNAGGCLQSG